MIHVLFIKHTLHFKVASRKVETVWISWIIELKQTQNIKKILVFTAIKYNFSFFVWKKDYPCPNSCAAVVITLKSKWSSTTDTDLSEHISDKYASPALLEDPSPVNK